MKTHCIDASFQIDTLEDELLRQKRLTRGGSQEAGANMEYLKNVVLSYMLSNDHGSREHMLKAIGAVLIFSRQEMKQVGFFIGYCWIYL